jgi:hypothetical protein
MYRRALQVLFIAALTFAPQLARAQAVWQPTPPPLVTAENESWFRAGSPIEWNGDFYYPAGAPQAFDPYVMVSAGSYRGIPLYTDSTLEPYSIVFVPISGSRMQPYEHLRAGMLADTTGSRTPWFPPQTSAALDVTTGVIAQAPAPPTLARPYDLVSANPPPSVPVATNGTFGTTAPQPSATIGRAADDRPVSTAVPPKGINNAWLEFDGRQWIADGKAIARSPDLHEIGEYRGFPVFVRGTDKSTIYVPSTAELVVPYRPK